MEAPGLGANGINGDEGVSSPGRASFKDFTSRIFDSAQSLAAKAARSWDASAQTGGKSSNNGDSESTPTDQSSYSGDATAPHSTVLVGSEDGYAVVDVQTSSQAKRSSVPERKAVRWDRMFNRRDYLETLKTEGLAGQLQEGCFRSVAWKLYLGVLPENKDDWATAISKSRAVYEAELKKWVLDPHDAFTGDDTEDLAKTNPLAIDDDAPWQRHFQDEQFKKMIQQDVHRTFPEVPFFHTPKVQQDMLNILFCYARSQPELSYRQGMHELLAGLYLTVSSDVADPTADETKEYPDIMLTVLDPEYVAHDAYALFCVVMETASGWFAQTKEEHVKDNRRLTDDAIAFQKASALDDTTSIIMLRLNRIHNSLLKRYDTELYHRLKLLDIAPQIYGLRWIRVLFAREFSLPDTFRLWDAIFADDRGLGLADYIFVAMLCYFRKHLITQEMTRCLRLLMSPLEGVADIQFIIELALHIRTPQIFPRPVVSEAPTESPAPKSSRESSHLVTRAVSVPVAPTTPAASAPSTRRGTSAGIKTSPPVTTPPPAGSTGPDASEAPPAPADDAGDDGPPTFNPSSTSAAVAKSHTRLQAKYDALVSANKSHGVRLDEHLRKLQDELLVTDRLPNDDVMFLALAGIKEIKDILLGRLQE
eukprot:m.380805 g.380805  ORF g.380805 m.380805 type:complete len:648 (-) comp20962_c0_seq2:249-2192(-)